MPLTPTQIRSESDRRVRHLVLRAAEDIRRLRLDAGLSIAAVARATGLHPGHLWHIEAGDVCPSLDVATRIGVALGADFSVRYFAGAGPRIHDRISARMTEALLRTVHARWRRSLEVPVGRPSRGVIDMVLEAELVIAVEIQSELRRLEQQVRWGHEKALALGEEHSTVSELLVLRSTRANRELAREFETILRAAYPARARDAYEALTGTAAWPGAAIVWIQVNGAEAHLMRLPPHGVSLGR